MPRALPCRAKASAEALVSHFLFKLFGLLPAAIILPIWRPMAYKASLSFSNVKGPTEPLEFAGCPIARVSFVSLAHHTIGERRLSSFRHARPRPELKRALPFPLQKTIPQARSSP
jgi:hypothetical protein